MNSVHSAQFPAYHKSYTFDQHADQMVSELVKEHVLHTVTAHLSIYLFYFMHHCSKNETVCQCRKMIATMTEVMCILSLCYLEF